MSNSSLVSYVKISPNSTNPRRGKIKKITIHHMAGNLTVEQCGKIFAAKSRRASSNYGVGSDGRIGMYCEEKNRSWCSSSPTNDNQAITIEVANNGGAPNWPVGDTALEATIELCADICKRNGIPRLYYTGDKSGNLTMHKWFANTLCPGPYLGSKFGYIADEVNKILSGEKTANTPSFTGGIIHGDIPGVGGATRKLMEKLFAKKSTTHVKNESGARKTIDELAREVISGKWGNGATRRQSLTKAGYDYTAVQARVKEILGN